MDAFSKLCLHYRNELRPILEMLKQKKTLLKEERWLTLVQKTKHSIIHTPEEYLINPERSDTTKKAVQYIFEEFLVELKMTTHHSKH